MSDILIKGMEMPPDCTSCPFCVVFPKKQLGMCVAFGDGSNREKLNGRMENCPLIELPPHGDLIDRGGVLRALAVARGLVNDQTAIDIVERFIKDTTVVVPAERRESND